jgi:hypothetical protein
VSLKAHARKLQRVWRGGKKRETLVSFRTEPSTSPHLTEMVKVLTNRT